VKIEEEKTLNSIIVVKDDAENINKEKES